MLLATLAAAPSAGSTHRAIGSSTHAQHKLDATDTAHMHFIPDASYGSTIVEEGYATGALPGRIRAHLNVSASVRASFTIYVKGGGTVSGKGSGRLKGRAADPSFGGVMTVSHGTGRFASAHGRGNVYGTLNRSTLAMTVQTTGTLYY
jgi:hypothetical protein